MDAHGEHGDAHGPDAGHDPHGVGPAEIPPVPAVRSIPPSASEYAQPWPGAGLLWPVLWLGVALLLYSAAGRTAHPLAPHGAADHAVPD